MDYEFLEHTADVKFRARGKTFEEMLINAARAMNEVIRGDIIILEKEEIIFEVEGRDLEGLLYNFLEEFLFLLDAKDFLTKEVKILSCDLEKLKVKVKVIGDAAENYKFTNDVKAITFNEMYVEKGQSLSECQVVLDV